VIPVKPAISVIVAGFGVREASWDRLRSCLQAVAAQEIAEHVEVLLCEMAELYGEVPEDIKDTLPGLRVLRCATDDLCARKTLAAQKATAPIVAFLDADCMPQVGWLRSILDTFRYYPEVAVVGGQVAGERASWLRVLWPVPTTAENVAFRREAYLDCPFQEGSGADAVRLQSAALRRARYVLWTESAMLLMRDRRGLAQAAGVGQALCLPPGSTRRSAA